MIIWVILLLFLGAFGWTGNRLGAVRMTINMIGLILGAALGAKFGPRLLPLAAKVGDGDNPLFLYVAPPLVVLLIVYVVFACIAYMVGDKLYMYYKYEVPDEWRIRFDRMNSRVGICMGVLNAVAHFTVLGLIVYSLGYWTVQLQSEAEGGSGSAEETSKSPPPPRPGSSGGSGSKAGKEGGAGASLLAGVATPLRESLGSSGLEKFIAAWDPLPDKFYDLADVVGLLYHNPSAARRLQAYPGTIGLAEQPELLNIARDTAFHAAWARRPPLKELLAHDHVRAIFRNRTLADSILAVDARDAFSFLKDGRTTKYTNEPILGRWEIHIPSTVVEVGKNNPALASDLANLALLRRSMITLTADVALLATPDSKLMVKGSLPDHKPLADLLNGRLASVRTNEPNAKVLISGTWKKEGGKGEYAVTFGEGGKPEKLQVLENNSLRTGFFGGTLIFTRTE